MSTEALGRGTFAVHYATDIGEFSFSVTTLRSAEWWAAFLLEHWGDRTWVTTLEGKEVTLPRVEGVVASLR